MPNGFITTLVSRLELQDALTPGLRRTSRALADLGVKARVDAAPKIGAVARSLDRLKDTAIVGRPEIAKLSVRLADMARSGDISRPALGRLSTNLRILSRDLAGASEEAMKHAKIGLKLGDTALETARAGRIQARQLELLARGLERTGREISIAERRTRAFNEPMIGFGVEHGPRAYRALAMVSSAAHGAMLAFSALRGSVIGALFSVIFLRFSILRIVATVGVLIVSIGGAVKILSLLMRGFIENAKAASGLAAATSELSRVWTRFFREAGTPLLREAIVPLVKALTELSVVIINILTPTIKILTPVLKILLPIMIGLGTIVFGLLIPVFSLLVVILLKSTAKLIAAKLAAMGLTAAKMKLLLATRAATLGTIAHTVALKAWTVGAVIATKVTLLLSAAIFKFGLAILAVTVGLAVIG